ncbi:MAG: MoxR family ATPase [Verrucomicrobiota bacterium]
MVSYPFDIIPPDGKPLPEEALKTAFERRPCEVYDTSLRSTASYYEPGEALRTAINTSIAIGAPLVLTGEPGCGKTQAAYYVEKMLFNAASEEERKDPKKRNLYHFQAKSDSAGGDLLYEFDMVRYFREAHIGREQTAEGEAPPELDKWDYVEPRQLWLALERSKTADRPAILLIDEIDKAPRDFPNDLLHELDQMEFTIKELDAGDSRREIGEAAFRRPVVIITSNDERKLPDAFLRRCVYHHIELNDEDFYRIVLNRRKKMTEEREARIRDGGSTEDAYSDLFLLQYDDGENNRLLRGAIDRFLSIRGRTTYKKPATGELLVWLQVLAIASEQPDAELLNVPDSELPYLHTLVKDRKDLKAFKET